MARLTVNRALNCNVQVDLAPWRSGRYPIKAEAGEEIVVPDDVAFAIDHFFTRRGYAVTWIESPSEETLSEQEALAERYSPTGNLDRAGMTLQSHVMHRND